jgi:beta-N-acetylhexosaminidase
MDVRPPERGDASVQTPPEGFELPEIEWPTLRSDDDPPSPPPEPPERPREPRPRRRRLLLWALLTVAGVVGVVLLVLDDSGDKQSQREKAQLEAAAPGSSKGPKVAPTVERTSARLSLPRAVAQLFVVGTDAQYPRDAFFGRLRARDWGGVVLDSDNVVDPAQTQSLVGEIAVVARRAHHLRPLVAAGQEGGPASTFTDLPPRAQPLAGDRGSAAARRDARAAARSLRELGVRMALAPVADVGVAAGPLQDRVFADEARTVTRLTAAAVQGWRSGGVAPAVGHFPGQGSASEDPDVANATVGLSLDELRRRDLRPFARVARRAPVIVMSNAMYATWDGVTPATALPEAVKLLRGDLRFRGVVMTPDLTATAPVLGAGVGAAAVRAIEAGADLLYLSGTSRQQDAAYRAVLRAVRKKRISRERLRLSLQRVLNLKRRYGLLPDPPRRRATAKSRRARPQARRAAPREGAPEIRARGTADVG